MDALDAVTPPGWIERLWETAAFYEFYAMHYGFLPSQVDGERQMIMELFPAIRAVRVDIENDRRRAEERASG